MDITALRKWLLKERLISAKERLISAIEAIVESEVAEEMAKFYGASNKYDRETRKQILLAWLERLENGEIEEGLTRIKPDLKIIQAEVES